MSEMIERVARRLAENDPIYEGRPFAHLADRIQDAFRSDARVAIEAMREPTEEMRAAAYAAAAAVPLGNDLEVTPDLYWTAMIDRAAQG